MIDHVCGMTLNDEHWCPELKKHAFVRIHNGGGRGRIVSGPCFMVQSDQGGAPQIVDEQDLTAVRSTSSATDEAMQGKGRHGDRLPLTHVALRFSGTVWSLPRPYRHHHIIRMICWLDPDVESVDCDADDQGFLDSAGRYLNRRQAEVNAELHGQITARPERNGKIIGSVLTSEDLW